MNEELRSISRSNFVVVAALIAFAPAAWFTHLAVTYALVPWSCRLGTDLPLHSVTLLAVVGLVASGSMALGRGSDDDGNNVNHKSVDDNTVDDNTVNDNTVGVASTRERIRILMSDSSDLPPERRTLPLVALAFAAYFALVVAMTGLVSIVVDRCA